VFTDGVFNPIVFQKNLYVTQKQVGDKEFQATDNKEMKQFFALNIVF
jgi:hypothetical protein